MAKNITALTCLLCLLLVPPWVVRGDTEYRLYAKDYAIPGVHRSAIRTNAIGQKTVLLRENDMLKFAFCLVEPAYVQIQNVTYSNDGDIDIFSVLVDWNPIGTHQTNVTGLGGAGWNRFTSTGPVGEQLYLEPGRHSVTIQANRADTYGFEVDNIQVYVGDPDLSRDTFTCKVLCFGDIKFNQTFGRDQVASARLEQASIKTNCTEKSNVKIPFYHPNIRKFTVEAKHPQYKTHFHNRQPNFTNCEIGVIWKFEDFSYPFPTLSYDISKAFATAGTNDDHNLIIIYFNTEGPSIGLVETDIGSELSLSLKNLREPITIGFQYYGRNKDYTTPEFFTFTPDQLNTTWVVPDYTWVETTENLVRLLLPLNLTSDLQVERVALTKRATREDTAFKIFDNSEKVIEGVNVDFFWRAAGAMTIRIHDSGEVYDNADYIRIGTHLPWGKSSYSQIFVLYRDGNIRILPISPPGMDWIPFGSSLLIGTADPNESRPFASISEVVIDMKSNRLYLTYRNGDTATIEVHVGFDSTKITVKDIDFQSLQDRPFLIYSSMWTKDGSADVDHVIINGNEPRRILSGWTELYGTSIVFFRQCLSNHNTLSPDIRIELLEED